MHASDQARGEAADGPGAAPGVLIEARAVAKSFGATRALDGVSFSLARGTITGLIGANGAGKSTLMRILAGALRPDRGQAFIAGADMAADPLGARAQLGYLPETANGFSTLTVAEFLAFAAEGRGPGRGAPAAAVAAIAERLDLTRALGATLGTLSKGWRQRAWLAQAMIHDPPVLILDEPTDGLDPTQKAALRGLLRAAAPTKAILMSTHILEEAEALCDRVIVLADGRVAADAPLAAMLGGNGRLAPAFARFTGAA